MNSSMASLQELLVEEGFERQKDNIKSHQKKVKFRDRRARDESIVLPIYVCHDRRRSFDAPKQKSGKASSRNGSVASISTRRAGSDSGISMTGTIDEGFFRRNEPALDEVAIRAVVSILSGYIGQYLRDKKFRETIRAKCYSCFTRNKDSESGDLENMQSGIEVVERLVEHQGPEKELNVKSLQYCIRLLGSTISSVNSKSSKNGTSATCRRQNSQLAACAELYLSIVYKVYRSDRVSARHLLQVFCDSPHIARTNLLPEVWEHLFLPHLLHIKIWYNEELESLSNSMYPDEETKMKALDKAYNDQMDIGTQKFALYYKEWLKDGAKAPAVPSVHLPSTANGAPSRRHSESFSSHSSNKSSLYRAIFGPILERHSTWGNDKHENLSYHSCPEDQEKFFRKEDKIDMESRSFGSQRSSTLSDRKVHAELWPDNKKSDYFRLFNCRSDMAQHGVRKDNTLPNASVEKDRKRRISLSNDLSTAVRTICTSDSLADCETAIRLMANAWLNSHGDPTVETAISKAQVIEAIMDVLSASSDDEILELAISLLAQIVTKQELNANIIMNFDPQLDIFARLLRDNSLFLKASILLYLVKPKAKQMIAMEWIPLVLRILEFGDHLQTLFTIHCSPQVAAYYFLDQLLNCFDEDKNMENARYVVAVGGLNLLLRRVEIGDIVEKNKAASIIYYCIQADGSCRHYLAQNFNNQAFISLLALKDKKTQNRAFALLTELFCLHRHHERIELLSKLIKGWGRMNALHILLVYLQKAQPEERPLVAAILLQLDILGDPSLLGLELSGDSSECSVYRCEAVEEIVKAMDCQVLNEQVQEQSARTLLILAGHFSYTGEPVAEKWLLKQAGFDENSLDAFSCNKVAFNNFTNLVREDEEAENWRRRTAMILLKSGRRNLLVALSDSMANGIPRLARASLVTVTWISSFLHWSGERSLQPLACSILAPQLIEALNYENSMEERILASFSLLNLLKGSDGVDSLQRLMTKELVNELDNLSQVTWTAKELISVITSSSNSGA
ncbi:putative E3 ubiquitin-protein ligase LIN [Coffea arabica]|uniref:E3 ubiquitin-protein ligase LIN n=1 Tax=Coffea arabica TaxID=13443 RepID=A0A6P6UD94_COFAR|nr:putative E3 ubiquitin-protein ligase LIN [Coffea arabica]